MPWVQIDKLPFSTFGDNTSWTPERESTLGYKGGSTEFGAFTRHNNFSSFNAARETLRGKMDFFSWRRAPCKGDCCIVQASSERLRIRRELEVQLDFNSWTSYLSSKQNSHLLGVACRTEIWKKKQGESRDRERRHGEQPPLPQTNRKTLGERKIADESPIFTGTLVVISELRNKRVSQRTPWVSRTRLGELRFSPWSLETWSTSSGLSKNIEFGWWSPDRRDSTLLLFTQATALVRMEPCPVLWLWSN